MTLSLDLRAIEDLVTRVDAQLPQRSGRMIGFIASSSGEGTTTLASAYAKTVGSHSRRRVLLLNAAPDNAQTPGVLPSLVADLPLGPCLRPYADNVVAGSLGGASTGDALWKLLALPELWQDLRGQYDDIVLDLPAASSSRLGLTSAALCDGVVVVLEAEKTRAPVVENLIASLRAVRAPILGTVMNRRRFHLPKRVYQWL
jgi:Mrp family chromosome partitioning ATPase